MPEHFNVPPGWPVPFGWTPPPGWEPDPSWPAAPAGWKFWVDGGPGDVVDQGDRQAAGAYRASPESGSASAAGKLPLILGIVGVVVLIALAGGVAMFLHGRGTTASQAGSDDQWTETSKTLAAPAPAPAPAPVVLPLGAVECGVSAGGTYRGAAKGTDSTSCPFVENVRDAFNNAGGQVPSVVHAYSPVTGKDYQMSCAMEQVITCRGGVNAVVYVYAKDTPPVASAGAAPGSVDPLLFTPLGGHGRAMNLQPDGSGTLEFSSGASNSDKWNVRWTQQTDGIFEITAVSQISQYGDGTGTHVGSQWLARFQQERGFTVLRMVKPEESFDDPAEPGFSMCTAEAKLQSVCGA